MADPLDQPADHTHELVFPFVACTSQGGRYPDEPFVAGVALGRIDRALEVAAPEVDRMSFTTYTALLRQLELCGMARSFPVVTTEQVAETDDHPAMPKWAVVTFARRAVP